MVGCGEMGVNDQSGGYGKGSECYYFTGGKRVAEEEMVEIRDC